MIIELLRLKLRLLANGFREPRTAVWAAFGILLAAATVVLLWTGASLAVDLDAVTRHRVVVVAGALVSLGAFFVPLLVARSQLLHPRALWLFGFRPLSIAGTLLLTTLVGPALLLLPIALAPLGCGRATRPRSPRSQCRSSCWRDSSPRASASSSARCSATGRR